MHDTILYNFGVYKYMQSCDVCVCFAVKEHECSGYGLNKDTNLLLK